MSNDFAFVDGDDGQSGLGSQRCPEICHVGNRVVGLGPKSLALNLSCRRVLIRRLVTNLHGENIGQLAGNVDRVVPSVQKRVAALTPECMT